MAHHTLVPGVIYSDFVAGMSACNTPLSSVMEVVDLARDSRVLLAYRNGDHAPCSDSVMLDIKVPSYLPVQ